MIIYPPTKNIQGINTRYIGVCHIRYLQTYYVKFTQW